MSIGSSICTICNGPFDMDTEGGILGDIGILPIAFCPTCFAGVMDMADQLREREDSDYEPSR